MILLHFVCLFSDESEANCTWNKSYRVDERVVTKKLGDVGVHWIIISRGHFIFGESPCSFLMLLLLDTYKYLVL